jgi:hypothetical protein
MIYGRDGCAPSCVLHLTCDMNKRARLGIGLVLALSAVASPVPAQQSTDFDAIIEATLDYWEERARSLYSLPDGPFAIDLRPARVTTPSGPVLDPDAARHATPEMLRRVAAARGSPIGIAEEMTECHRGKSGRVFCEVAGAAAIVGFGQAVIDGATAQVEVRTWYRREGPPFMPEPSWNLNVSGVVLTLEERDGDWRVLEARPIFS